jgi:uncharacterized protein DUF4440
MHTRTLGRGAMGMATLLLCSAARGEQAPVSEVLEIRSYSLKPGTRDRFHALVERDALPMLRRWVNVRLMGDFAIIHAQTTFTTRDGRAGRGRYTDVWARRDGRWLAISAHVTRK